MKPIVKKALIVVSICLAAFGAIKGCGLLFSWSERTVKETQQQTKKIREVDLRAQALIKLNDFQIDCIEKSKTELDMLGCSKYKEMGEKCTKEKDLKACRELIKILVLKEDKN